MAGSAHETNSKVIWDDQRYAKATLKIEVITGLYARHLMTQAGLPDYPNESPLIVLDHACGAGVLTSELQAVLQGRPQDSYEITCGDIADAMIDATKQRAEKESWMNTKVANIDAEDTKLADEYFTHVLINLGVMVFAKPSQALSECYRILRPGGICGFTTWESLSWLPSMRAAMESIPDLPELPSEIDMDLANVFSKEKIWHDPAAIHNFVAHHNFESIESKIVSAVSVFEDMEELRHILKPPFSLMTKFFWTPEQRDALDNTDTYQKILAWFEKKLNEGSIRWDWSVVVTTCTKPA